MREVDDVVVWGRTLARFADRRSLVETSNGARPVLTPLLAGPLGRRREGTTTTT
jgi:hypothetical protein